MAITTSEGLLKRIADQGTFGTASTDDLETKIDTLNTKVASLFDRQNASNGITMIKGTAAQTETTGTYYALQCITNCTFDTLTGTGCTLLTSVLFPAGTIIYADILTVTANDSAEVYALYKV